MPLLIVDGPEAAGKTTFIAALVAQLDHDARTVQHRRWGPVPSWEAYVDPLGKDLEALDRGLVDWVVWDRGWPSESVYNELLARGKVIDERVVYNTLTLKARSAGALLLIIAPPAATLIERRRVREAAGLRDDLPVAPEAETAAFRRYGVKHGWTVVSAAPDVRPFLRGVSQ